jgi:hypothetical protein
MRKNRVLFIAKIATLFWHFWHRRCHKLSVDSAVLFECIQNSDNQPASPLSNTCNHINQLSTYVCQSRNRNMREFKGIVSQELRTRYARNNTEYTIVKKLRPDVYVSMQHGICFSYTVMENVIISPPPGFYRVPDG